MAIEIVPPPLQLENAIGTAFQHEVIDPQIIILRSRPANPMYKADDTDSMRPDIIIKPDAYTTYYCWGGGVFRKRLRYFKILREQKSADGKVTTNMYPWGCDSYDFRPADVSTYDYDYRT